MAKDRIQERILAYLHFWGLSLTEPQIEGLMTYLQRFTHDIEELENEMICEIRRLTD